jgi:hypothetical protein
MHLLYLTSTQTVFFSTHFTRNDEIISLHWFTLFTVLNQLPVWNKYLDKQVVRDELAQTGNYTDVGVKLNTGNGEYTL